MNNKIYVTPDIAIAAFLLTKSMHMISADKRPGMKFCFVFDDQQNKADDYVIEFFNSECFKFDFNMKKLRRLH